jgi:glycosyltransferase involved in cell wall biosynthesis
MRIGILNVQAPFVRGGAELLAESLQEQLREAGHQATIIRIPFKWYPPDSVLQHMLACRLIDLPAEYLDLVIALKFPAYLVPFAPKRLWLLHQFRQVYELWRGSYQQIPDTPDGRRIRDAVIAADNRFLREADAIYTNSRIVARRLATFNGIQANGVLYPPLPHPELYHCDEYGSFFFYPSRLASSKRQAVAIEAMRHVRSDFKLLLAGSADDDYGRQLEEQIARSGLDGRVVMLGWISDQEKADLMAKALAVLYLPYDEDSYGYVTLEAFQSHKPVVTFTDSGGIDELIEHESNGLIIEPTPEALAEHMEALWASTSRTRALGDRGYETLRTRNIGWDYVLEHLLA